MDIGEIETLNWSIIAQLFEWDVKNLPQNTWLGPGVSASEFQSYPKFQVKSHLYLI